MTTTTNGTTYEILLVEDNPGDVRLTQKTLAESNVNHNLTVAEDGETALAILHKDGEHGGATRPDMILLDLGLPKMDGREVLAEIKADPDLKRIPIVVLTSSSAEHDLLASYNLQVNNYLTKPVTLNQFNLVFNAAEMYLKAIKRMFGSP